VSGSALISDIQLDFSPKGQLRPRAVGLLRGMDLVKRTLPFRPLATLLGSSEGPLAGSVIGLGRPGLADIVEKVAADVLAAPNRWSY
jgi:hypothetical protein